MRCVPIDECYNLAHDPWPEVIESIDVERALQQLSDAERTLLEQWLSTNPTPEPTTQVQAILNQLRQTLE